jgi:hypothetical protein
MIDEKTDAADTADTADTKSIMYEINVIMLITTPGCLKPFTANASALTASGMTLIRYAGTASPPHLTKVTTAGSLLHQNCSARLF